MSARVVPETPPEESLSDRDVLSSSLSKTLVDTLIPAASKHSGEFAPSPKNMHLSSKVHFTENLDVRAGRLPMKEVAFVPLDLAMEYVKKVSS
jgi:hypothetical protein